MAEKTENLWPSEFKIDVQSPLTILRAQAEQLGRLTRGILNGSVESEESGNDIQHRLNSSPP